MTEYTARSFAEQYKVDVSTARKYLNALLESGRARAVNRPLPIRFNGKDVVTRRTVITYRIRELTTYQRWP